MTIAITEVASSDIDALVRSVTGLFVEDGGRHDRFMDLGWPRRCGAEYYAGLVGDQACLLALARDGEQVVGHLVGKLAEPGELRTVRFAILESIRVAAQARRSGVGGELVAAFFEWARDRGAEVASVTAFAGNVDAHRFYARHGFTPHTVTRRAVLR